MRYHSLAALLLVAACAASGPPAPIPAPMAETIPKPPVSAAPLIWQPGHWDWTGNSFLWIQGQYVDTTGHSATWMPGFWEQAGGGWVWRPAHWM